MCVWGGCALCVCVGRVWSAHRPQHTHTIHTPPTHTHNTHKHGVHTSHTHTTRTHTQPPHTHTNTAPPHIQTQTRCAHHSGALRTVQIKITRNFVIMIFIHKRHSIGMFITCVGGKGLQLLVGVELRSHDTVL